MQDDAGSRLALIEGVTPFSPDVGQIGVTKAAQAAVCYTAESGEGFLSSGQLRRRWRGLLGDEVGADPFAG